MGTSTAQPSPKTKEWQEAREQYKQRNAAACDVVRAVARAVDPRFEADMAGVPVARCLEVLLRHADEGALDADPDASTVGFRIRESARQELAESGTSRQAEVALDAVFLTALAQVRGRREHAEQDLPRLDRQFMAHYVAGVFTHLIARDSADFVGSEGLPTVGDRAILERQCERLCVDAVYSAEFEPISPPSVSREERAKYVSRELTPLVGDVLSRLRKGGAAQ